MYSTLRGLCFCLPIYLSSLDTGNRLLNRASVLALALALAFLLNLECRANLTPPHVVISDNGEGLNLDNILRVTISRCARPSLAAVEPVHEAALVPPDAHSKNHTPRHRLAHALVGAQLEEPLGTSSGAELVVQTVDLGETIDVNRVGLNGLAILLIEPLDGGELAVLVGGELGDDGERAAGVDLELVRVAVVVGHVDAVGVPPAAGLVADTGLGAAALLAFAEVEAGLVARVGRDVGGAGVGLPNVHLVAAGALAFDVALFRRNRVSKPPYDENQMITWKSTYLTTNEGGGKALSVAVTSAVVSTALVELALVAIGGHLAQVQSRVHAARKAGGVDVEGELVAGELEHLILLLGLVQKVDSWADKLSVGENVLESQGRLIGRDTVGRVVGDTVHDAVFRAGLLGRAGGGVGLLAPVTAAILRSSSLVDGVSKRVEDDVVGLGLAAVLLAAAVGGDLGVHLLGGTGLLGNSQPAEGETGREKSGEGGHGGGW